MPSKPPKACQKPGCPNTSPSQYCDEHSKTVPKTLSRYRGTAASRGYDSDWQHIRLKALHRDNYCCMECAKKNILTPAVDVDHRIPVTVDSSLRLIVSNLQSLCRSCHQSKTFSEQHR